MPRLVQYVTPENKDWWKANAEPLPGPLPVSLCAIARSTGRWQIPGSMFEVDGDNLYNTALVISPQGEIMAKYRKMFPWLPFDANTTPGN